MFVTRPMLAKHFSCHQSTITNWVRKGLLPPPATRSPSGRPLWAADVIQPKTAGSFPSLELADVLGEKSAANPTNSKHGSNDCALRGC